jgi:hypothetical protein
VVVGQSVYARLAEATAAPRASVRRVEQVDRADQSAGIGRGPPDQRVTHGLRTRPGLLEVGQRRGRLAEVEREPAPSPLGSDTEVRSADGPSNRGATLDRRGHRGGVEGVHRRGESAPVEAEQVCGRRQHPLGGGEVLQRADDVHVRVRDDERPAEPTVHHRGSLPVTEGQERAQGPFQQLHDPVVAPAGPQPEASHVHVGCSLLRRRCGPAQETEPGLGQAHRDVEGEAVRRQVRGAIHERRRFDRVSGRARLQGVTGGGDHVSLRGMHPQHGVDGALVQPLAPR